MNYYRPINIYDAQGALSFAIQQATNIESTIYQTRYPSFDYASLVPVITQGNEWARSTTFFSVDFAGRATWLSGSARDIPYADIDHAKYEQAFYMAGIGYRWNIEEINVARMLGMNIADDKAQAARKISEQFLWNLAMSGDTEKGWTGLVNDATVSAGNVAADGTGASTLWSTKTPDQILRDVNSGLTSLFTGTSEVEMADTIILPTSRFLSVSTLARSATSDTTILAFLQKNNSLTAENGQALTIRASRKLETAGAGGTARMVLYRRDPEVLRFHLPMPHTFFPVWQSGPMEFMVPGIFRTGGVEVRLPGAMKYLDGI